jgi:Protein of unknown function (DUF3460)
MSIFARPHYTSEATDFIESLKASHPEMESKQREGRSLLWDKNIDRTVQADIQSGRIAQKPYPYQAAPTEL